MKTFLKAVLLSSLTAALVCPLGALAQTQEPPPGVNALQAMMLYRSFVQDDDACQVDVLSGQPMIVGPNAGSAAAACPDAFAWIQLAEAISQEWWNWGIDQTIWPGKPLPLCSATVTTDCCDPHAEIDPSGTPNASCPYFRADYSVPSPLPAIPNGTPNGSAINHRGMMTDDIIDPARLLRDLELELVFRNKPMIDYIYRNDLYTREGFGARNRAQNAAMSGGDIAGAHAFEVRFPIDAVMVKADFLHQDIMLDQELITATTPGGGAIDPPNNPDYPYLTVYLDGNGAPGNVPGYYYLIAMTNASKDLPNWHWYAIEHVANQGRCDYIGCNDSFGYQVNGAAQPGANFGSSFIPPMFQLNDDKTTNNDPLFVTGQVYDPAATGEQPTQSLLAMFAALGIAAAPVDPDPRSISIDDPAWMNYRLKGTQTSFVTSGGVPTGMGASVTEGGFVNSASCMTCHAQASVDANGSSGMQGVGASWRPDVLGYGEVEMGAPLMAWFYENGGPSISATQIDFVWGILNAQCVTPGQGNNCASYPDAPTIIQP
jgi:hypothetical protein